MPPLNLAFRLLYLEQRNKEQKAVYLCCENNYNSDPSINESLTGALTVK